MLCLRVFEGAWGKQCISLWVEWQASRTYKKMAFSLAIFIIWSTRLNVEYVSEMRIEINRFRLCTFCNKIAIIFFFSFKFVYSSSKTDLMKHHMGFFHPIVFHWLWPIAKNYIFCWLFLFNSLCLFSATVTWNVKTIIWNTWLCQTQKPFVKLIQLIVVEYFERQANIQPMKRP